MTENLTFEQFAEISRHCVDGNAEALNEREIMDFLYIAGMLGSLAGQDYLAVTLDAN